MSILERFTKQPSDVQDYDIDFTAWLTALSDTGASAIAVAESGITINSSSLTGSVVKVWVSGGVHGRGYKVTVTLTTTGGRVKEVEIVIKVKET